MEWKMSVYFMAHWYNLISFGIIPCFGMFAYEAKSGNPAHYLFGSKIEFSRRFLVCARQGCMSREGGNFVQEISR
jgi:hypothetical protein